MTFVLDASMSLSWLFEREKADERKRAAAALGRLEGEPAIVPPLWMTEVLNGVLVAERAKKALAAQVADYLTRLAGLPITIDSVTPSARRDAILGLGRQYGLTAYDATYLDLAMRLAAPLATFDTHLAKAAKVVGLEVV